MRRIGSIAQAIIPLAIPVCQYNVASIFPILMNNLRIAALSPALPGIFPVLCAAYVKIFPINLQKSLTLWCC